MPRVTLRRTFFLDLTLATVNSQSRLFEETDGRGTRILMRRGPTDQCFRSLTPFFPATVFLRPLRVRAFVLVRCPRTGRPRR